MAVKKSIIDMDINVNDEAFQRYNTTFTKYQEALKKMPGAWGEVGAKVSETGGWFLKMTAALLAQAEILKRNETAHEHIRDSAKKTAGYWAELGNSAANFADKIERTTTTLLRWAALTGVFTGLVGGATGLFGLDRMARNVTSDYRQAQGLRMPSGEMIGAQVAFGQIVDVQSALARMMDIKNQPGSATFGMLGVKNASQKDPGQLMIESMTKARDYLRQNPSITDPVLQAMGILPGPLGPGVFGDRQEANRAAAQTPAEWAQRQKDAARTALPVTQGGLAMTDKAQKGWADFTQQLTEAGAMIQSIFGEKLAQLSGPLTETSAGLVDIVRALAQSDVVETWLTALSDGLQEFATWIRGPTFKGDLESFLADIKAMSEMIASIVHSFGEIASYFGFGSREVPAEQGAPGETKSKTGGGVTGFLSNLKSSFDVGLAQKQMLAGGLTPLEVGAFLGQAAGESSMDVMAGLRTNSPNPNAIGAWQWTKGRKSSLMSHRWGDPTTQDAQTKFLLQELHTTHASVLEHMRAVEANPNLTDKQKLAILTDIGSHEYEAPGAVDEAKSRHTRQDAATRYVPPLVPKVVVETRAPGLIVNAGTIGPE
jgi:hypothetical protein